MRVCKVGEFFGHLSKSIYGEMSGGGVKKWNSKEIRLAKKKKSLEMLKNRGVIVPRSLSIQLFRLECESLGREDKESEKLESIERIS